MKGLIIKDLYTIKGYARQYLLVLCFMIIWAVCMKSTSFAAMYAMLLGGMLVLTTMSTDEAAKFNRYALTMPVSVKDLARAKYLLLIISISTGILIGIIINAVTGLLDGYEEGFDAASLLAIGSLFLLTYSITLPLIYKYGIEKARYSYIGVLLGLGAAIFGILQIAAMVQGVPIEELPSPGNGMVVVLLLLIDVIAVAISFVCSQKILLKKEW